MKHTLKITLLIVALFLIAQLVGLATVNRHIQVFEDVQTGAITIEHPDTLLGPPAEVKYKSASFLLIALLVLIGTGLLLLLIRYRVYRLWKLWFFIAVWATMAVAFGVYINWIIASVLAFALGLWKIYRPNVYIFNFTEVFVYTGIAILILPILDLFAAFGLLVLISIYDMYAVWKSKHMIKMARFQTKTKVFAGILIPYSISPKAAPLKDGKKAKAKARSAILGGGDIAFPLIFSAVVMEYLITSRGLEKSLALGLTGLISLFAAISLLILLAKAEDQKFYPAMPFLSIGCFIGYIAILILI